MAISSEINTSEHNRQGGETVIFFLILCLLLGCSSRYLLSIIRERYRLRIPYSVMMMVIGMCLGVALWSEVHNDGGPAELTTQSLSQWVEIDPRLILFIFLPALIYESAMETNYYIFSKHFFSALVLAGPGMLAQSALIAAVAVYVLPYGWGWTESFLFGGILSATDPVAVIAILKELGVLPDLRVLIEAESLLNDGTAIVLFQICESMLMHPADTSTYIASAFKMIVGGPALGAGLFTGSFYWMANTLDPLEHSLITFCSSYLGFYLAEGTVIGASGVLAVVTMGILMAGYGKTAISTEEGQHMLHAVWGMIVFCAETVIFVLAGAIIIEKGFLRLKKLFTLEDWGYLLLLYLLLAIIRGVMVILCSPYFRTFGYNLKVRAKSMKEFTKCMLIVTWGGLRGAVGLMLALEVSQNEALRRYVSDELYNERVLLHTAGMVVLTTVVNAAMMEWVIGLLGLAEPNDAEKQMFRGAIRFLEDKHDSLLISLQNHLVNPQMAGVDWQAVEASVGKDKLTKALNPSEDLTKDKNSEPYGTEQHMASPIGRVRRMSNFMLGHWESNLMPTESGGDGQDDADTESVVAFSVTGGHSEEVQAQKGMIGRYLMSLRASYTSQWNKGLMAARPYRRVIWAISRALDHAGDSVHEADCFMKFEWGWLKSEGCLRIPRWMMRMTMIPGLRALGERLIRDEYSVQFEIVCAIIRAHEETSRCELRPTRHAEVFDRIVHDSIVLKQAAEAHLAQMEHEKPKVGMKVRTRQACCIVLTSFRERVNELHSLGQISHSEYERLCLHLTSKLNFFTEGYPKVNSEQRELTTLPIFRHIPPQAWHEEFEALTMSQVVKEKGSVLARPGEELESVKIIVHGVVKWMAGPDLDTDDPEERRSNMLDLEDREEYAMVAGSSFGEQEFLLSLGGYEAEWSGKAVALTEVRMYVLSVEALSGLCERHPFILCQLWMRAGSILIQTQPELFPNFPTLHQAENFFANCKLKLGAAGMRFFLRYPILLVRGGATLPDGTQVMSFKYLEPEDAEFITFSDHKNAILLFPPQKENIISRRANMAGGGQPSALAALEKQIVELRKDRVGEGSIGGTAGTSAKLPNLLGRTTKAMGKHSSQGSFKQRKDETGEPQTDYQRAMERATTGLRELQEAQETLSLSSGAEPDGDLDSAGGPGSNIVDELKATLGDSDDDAGSEEVEEIVQLIEEVNIAAKKAGTDVESGEALEVTELLIQMASIAQESSGGSCTPRGKKSPSRPMRDSPTALSPSPPGRRHRPSHDDFSGPSPGSPNRAPVFISSPRRITIDGGRPIVDKSRTPIKDNGTSASAQDNEDDSNGNRGGSGSEFVQLSAVPHARLLREELAK